MANKTLFSLMFLCSYALNLVLLCTCALCLALSTTVGNALQIHLFMQNKPNFRKSQMNVTDLLRREYEKWILGQRGKNEPNTKPIQTQSKESIFGSLTHLETLVDKKPAKSFVISGLTVDVLGPINPIQSSKTAFFGRIKQKYRIRLEYKESIRAIIPKSFRAVSFYKRKGAGRMDIYESQLSQSSVLNERIAGEIFGILPEDGPLLIIVGRDGNYWLNNSAKFSRLNISESFLKGLCAKIDDGAEPVVTQVNDFGVVAAQLATEETNCGYVIIALPQYSSESTLINIGLIEILLNQIGLIAKLVEKNGLAYELQTKQLRMYSYGDVASS